MTPQIKTLGDMAKVAPMFGPDAVEYVRLKIEECPAGEDEPVWADDTQIMFLLIKLGERSSAFAGQPV